MAETEPETAQEIDPAFDDRASPTSIASPVLPSSEKVIISARPPMLEIGTGPPSPLPSGAASKRLSAEWSRLSPIRNTCPSGTVISS